jgi:putative restriction endonuclease
MKTARAWALITLGDEREYAGNRGYKDETQRVYRYDSKVANHRNLSKNDLVFVRDAARLIGLARITRIQSRAGHRP